MIRRTKPRQMTDNVKNAFRWDRVNGAFTNIENCWEWNHTTSAGGYGQFYYEGYYFAAHRVAYFNMFDSDPTADLVVDHICNNRKCCNPYHMDVCTQSENSRRGTHDRGELKFHVITTYTTFDMDLLRVKAMINGYDPNEI